MSEKKELSVSSPSIAGEDFHDGFPREVVYHDTDVFGHEENHDVCSPALSEHLFQLRRLSRRAID